MANPPLVRKFAPELNTIKSQFPNVPQLYELLLRMNEQLGKTQAAVSDGLGVTTVDLAPTADGIFTVPHSLNAMPSAVLIEMTSGGQIWFQTQRYDANNLFLVASEAGVTGKAQVFS